MKLRTYVIAAFVTAATVMAFAPSASATNYNVCAPTNAVCLAQSDSPFAGPACDTYAWNYASNEDFTGVVVNAGPASAKAGGHNVCSNWFYNDGDAQGVFATANVGGNTAEAYWRTYDVDYHWPGAPQDVYGEYVIVRVNDGSAFTGVDWRTANTPSTGAATCDTALMVQGSSTSLGCPLGGPPQPPPLPWGGIIP